MSINISHENALPLVPIEIIFKKKDVTQWKMDYYYLWIVHTHPQNGPPK
jgi:hypothetical protein